MTIRFPVIGTSGFFATEVPGVTRRAALSALPVDTPRVRVPSMAAFQGPVTAVFQLIKELANGARVISGIADAAVAHAAAAQARDEMFANASDLIERELARDPNEHMRSEVCGPENAPVLALVVTTPSSSEHFQSHKESALRIAREALPASAYADVLANMQVFGEGDTLPR